MQDNINETALCASKDERVREELIQNQTQTILRTAGAVCHRHIDRNDDEWSVSLCAFSRAVDLYRADRGDFFPFAQMLIKRSINCFDYVLRVRAVNDVGETVLGAMDLKTVRHHRVDDAITTTMEQIEQGGYLEDPASELRVSAETRSERHADRLRQELGEMVSRIVPAPDGTAMAREPREEGREPEALPAPTENLMPETKEQQEPRPDEAERYEGPITIEGRPAGPEGEQRPDMRPAEQERHEDPLEPDGNGPGLPEQNEPPQNAPAFF